MLRWLSKWRYLQGRLLALVLAAPIIAMTGGAALSSPVPYIRVEGDPEQGQTLGITWEANQATFVYQQAFMPVDYTFLPSLTLRQPDGAAAPFPVWARKLIVSKVLLDWVGAGNQHQDGTQVMSGTLAAGVTGRYFDPNGERAAFQAVYGGGLAFAEVGADAAANMVFRFEDFGHAAIDRLLEDLSWPGKPAGPWQPWSMRTAGLEKDADGAITGAKDADGNPVAIAIDGLLGVWIPSQVVQQRKTIFNLPHDFQSDLILFNSRVAWNRTTDRPAGDRLDFYHVALHEIGHGLGLDHAVAEPASLALVGIGLVALAGAGRSRRRVPVHVARRQSKRRRTGTVAMRMHLGGWGLLFALTLGQAAHASVVVLGPGGGAPRPGDFPSVGIVNGDCTGTLLNGHAVLTARHCVTTNGRANGPLMAASDLSFALDHGTYSGMWLSAPDSADIAVFKINQYLDVASLPIYTGSQEVGMWFVGVGFGLGTSAIGPNGGLWDLPFGTKRVWFNEFDFTDTTRSLLGETDLVSDIDDPSTWMMPGGAIEGEGYGAPGDSGSPQLVYLDGAFHIAGVLSYGDPTPIGFPDHSFYREWRFGDRNGSVRVSEWSDWIVARIPVPSTVTLVILPLLVTFLMRGRRQSPDRSPHSA